MASKDNLSVMRDIFIRYDRDHTGNLSESEFISFLKSLSKHVPELKGVDSETMKAVFAIIDKNSDQKLTFEEFCKWWLDSKRYVYFEGNKAQLLRKAYELYKTYSSGEKMTHGQFELLLDEMDIEHTDYDFDELDVDEDGLLSFVEFCNWLRWF